MDLSVSGPAASSEREAAKKELRRSHNSNSRRKTPNSQSSSPPISSHRSHPTMGLHGGGAVATPGGGVGGTHSPPSLSPEQAVKNANKPESKISFNDDNSATAEPVDHSFATPENRFCKAAYEGDLALVKQLLVSNPAILNHTNTRKQTALYCASAQGQEAVVKYLLHQSTIDINSKANGSSALHTACWNGHQKIVVSLIEAGADVLTMNTFGELPHHNAQSSKVRAALADTPPMRAPKPHPHLFDMLWEQANERVADSCYELSLLYQDRGSDEDFEESGTMKNLAMDLGQPQACFERGYVQYALADYPTAIRYWHRAQERGHRGAVFNLGVCYMLGLGTDPDFNRGVAQILSYTVMPESASLSNSEYNDPLIHDYEMSKKLSAALMINSKRILFDNVLFKKYYAARRAFTMHERTKEVKTETSEAKKGVAKKLFNAAANAVRLRDSNHHRVKAESEASKNLAADNDGAIEVTYRKSYDDLTEAEIFTHRLFLEQNKVSFEVALVIHTRQTGDTFTLNTLIAALADPADDFKFHRSFLDTYPALVTEQTTSS
eukprot:TRINITY_DN10493_c0_g1_i1.p1 TRINITY_DN10493_c0_g1~~TRINITY_DN10493_c0_g1_i1.p1  ORF type:complete len:552 (-),score=96.50 TRINITY_DN10493_c0_g1_i1:48-1703(-)